MNQTFFFNGIFSSKSLLTSAANEWFCLNFAVVVSWFELKLELEFEWKSGSSAADISPDVLSPATFRSSISEQERIQFQQAGRIEKNLTTTKLVKANVLRLHDNNTKIIYWIKRNEFETKKTWRNTGVFSEVCFERDGNVAVGSGGEETAPPMIRH